MDSYRENIRKVAQEAERSLNTYEAKTGAHKTSPSDEAGVDSRVETKFPGARVKYGQDISTNAGYNKRIPPEEGGDLDARGRQTRGDHFEGVGGPEHKVGQQARDYGGFDELDSTNKRRPDIASKPATEATGAYGTEVVAQGMEAAQSNMESNKYMPHKGQYPGAKYHTPQDIPGEMSAEGYEAPASVTEASRESEWYNR
ncbi:hypothetical protein F4861DRAFT_540374 [Xylaria intraflava]|nr:hypothetical protein F4861DRAFT_540374 [Xylaria intraflava]